jgi:hypothetical protein
MLAIGQYTGDIMARHMSEWRHRELMAKLELIDWSERYPHEDSRTIAFRQSTVCPKCGKSKEIGVLRCGTCK